MAKAKSAFEITIAVPQALVDELAQDTLDSITNYADDEVLKTLKIKPASLLKNLKADPKFLAAAEKEIRRQVAEQYSPEECVDHYDAVDNIIEDLGAKHELQQLNVRLGSIKQQLEEAAKKDKFEKDLDNLIAALEARGYTVSKK
jgi:hypothetical protein